LSKCGPTLPPRRRVADHHVVDAPARQEAEVFQQFGDFRDELVHGLNQQGPVASGSC
jgi:hypothetical protein